MASNLVKTGPMAESTEGIPANPASGVRYVVPVRRPLRNLFQIVCLGQSSAASSIADPA